VKIVGLTVCVDYAETFTPLLPLWLGGLDFLALATSLDDRESQDLAGRYKTTRKIVCIATDAFTSGGAKFNKGAAISAAYDHLSPPPALAAQGLTPAAGGLLSEPDCWVLFFDADILPPPDWWKALATAKLEPGHLYGARRYKTDGTPEPDQDMAGFFLLAHASDPNMRVRPVVDTHWYHAGNYDSTFMDRWPRERRHVLPLHLVHHGEMGRNWCGVGNDADVRRLHAERRRRGGRWDHETVGG
jgi:hypothetical protein